MTRQELEMCIDEYGKEIYSFCKYLTCSLQEAEDLYQDTFLKAVELEDKIEYANNVKSYLLSIALRIWKNRKRKFAWRKRIADVRSVVEEKDTEIWAETHQPEEGILEKEKKETVRRAVAQLPKRLRIVILLFYMEELPVAQIAAILKIPNGTVKSRLYRARKLLKKELEDVLDEESVR